MTALPKISVIVPVFNAGNKLIPSIESLLSQTLDDLEIIIVNDASTDNSGEVIDQLAQANSNIVPVHFAENKGVHEARLAGLKKSTAQWIGFLDADDFARPNMFAALHAAAIDQNVDIVVCGSDRVTEQRKVIAPKLRFKRSEKVDKEVFERFCRFEFGTGMLWNKLFKRSVIESWFDLHFPWRQSINEDLLLNIGCFYHADSVFLMREVLHEYALVDTSVTTEMKNSWAYVETFRAYVLAVTSYQHLGESVLSNVIELYRTQIAGGEYQLTSINELNDHKLRLEEAARLLCNENPYALAAITARNKQTIVGGSLAVKSLLAAVMRKLNSIFQ
jgi:glycosyltransferase involved in cell wall biosynthesis